MGLNAIAIGLTVALIGFTVAISLWARRYNRTTAEFYLAGRKVNYITNASAICGDYFSAASFLGVAGAVYASGLDGLWFGTGFGAAFVPVLIFFASPIRRFGEYTLPDFLAARFQSAAARVAGIVAVQLVCAFYLVPQMVGAGTTWTILVGAGFFGMDAYTTGVVITVIVMAIYVAVGGQRGTTINQMVQFWILAFAMFLVAGLAFRAGFTYSRGLREISVQPLTAPARMRVADLLRTGPDGRPALDSARSATDPAHWAARVEPRLGDPAAEVTILLPQTSRLTGESMRFTQPGHRYHWLDQFSLVLALVFGTSGLPHIMNRYYTNPSGRAARWTTVWVLVMVGAFYMAAAAVGAAARALIPRLAAGVLAAGHSRLSDQTVSGVLTNSDTVLPFLGEALAGPWGLGIVAAGAFAAMFSTIGGLLMASAASWGHDLYEQYIDPDAQEWRKVAVGRISALVMAGAALAAGLVVPESGLMDAYPALIALMVTWAFSIAGGALVPALLMAIWWKRTTLRGALAGMAIGGGGSVFFIVLNMLRVLSPDPAFPQSIWGWLGQLTYPTVVTFPLALATTYLVSLADRRVPDNLEEIWARIHGTAAERQQRRLERLSRAAVGE